MLVRSMIKAKHNPKSAISVYSLLLSLAWDQPQKVEPVSGLSACRHQSKNTIYQFRNKHMLNLWILYQGLHSSSTIRVDKLRNSHNYFMG